MILRVAVGVLYLVFVMVPVVVGPYVDPWVFLGLEGLVLVSGPFMLWYVIWWFSVGRNVYYERMQRRNSWMQ